MSQQLSVIFAGGLVRVLQGFAAAAPTLLVGLFVAAFLKYYLGASGIRRLFGGDSWRSLPQSWLVGMLLPVCSIGVLPILCVMHRARVKPGAMSAFALSAPLFNPLSLLYGLTLSRPVVIVLFAVGSLVVVTLLGILWDMIDQRHESDSGVLGDDAEDHLIGFRRLIAAFVHVARESTGNSLGLTLIALSGLAILAGVLPYGAMQTAVERDDWWAPLRMVMVAMPVFATPMLAMSQLGMMFQHANSPGASFVLLILGTGMNLATPIWFGRRFGFRGTGIWLVALLVTVLVIAYSINRPLIPPGVEPAGHTHAFDIYANPIALGNPVNIETINGLVRNKIGISDYFSLGAFATLAVLGLLLRGFRVDEGSLVRTASAKSFASSLKDGQLSNRKGLDRVVPPQLIAIVMLAGVVAISVVACYAYYPSPNECLEEIRLVKAECWTAARSGNVEGALFWLPVWEDWSRKLEVGTVLRRGELRPYQRMQGYLIRKKLELLEHELGHDPVEQEEINRVLSEVQRTDIRWAQSFRN